MKKENLKPNVVLAPTLFVGIGGTGCGIVKTIAEMCHPDETKNVNFVCLDTNVNDLSDIAASKAHIYFVQTSSTQTVGSYLNYDEDALNNWFPKNAVMYDKTVSEGAGQLRAISRLAFNACVKMGRLKPLTDAIDDLFRKDGKEMVQALRVAIASTASGGTGSGLFLPLTMFIRDYVNSKYPNTSPIVRATILLPETLDAVIKSSQERESQRRNAYATIKEINAFMMKGSGFLDTDPQLQQYSDLYIDIPQPDSDEMKRLALLPCDFCFLVDGQDAENNTMINKSQYMNQAARALYEQNIGPMQRSAYSVEDNIIKELASPGNYGRNRFGGIGAATLRYPYEDIVSFVAAKWALDSINGTSGGADRWSKYDKAFKIKHEEERKKGLPEDEMTKRSDHYIDQIRTSEDTFTKNLRSRFSLGNAEERIENYIESLIDYIRTVVKDDASIQGARDAALPLGSKRNYMEDESKRGHASGDLGTLRGYEMEARKKAARLAKSTAEGIFNSELKAINADGKNYTIECLIRTLSGEICHPNAMRYLFYILQNEFAKRLDEANAELGDVNRTLANYQIGGMMNSTTSMFDLRSTKKAEETTLDEVCQLEAQKSDPGLIDKIFKGGMVELYDMLNKHFPIFYKGVEDFVEYTVQLEAFKVGLNFIKEANKQLEKFFESFGEKTTALERKQDDIIDSITFHKGDSILNIISKRDLVEELCLATSGESAEASLLTKDINSAIYDAIKNNIQFQHEIDVSDVVEDDKRIDLFDGVIFEGFRKKVMDDCPILDMNIIEAIAMEKRLIERCKARFEIENSGDKDEKVVDKVTAKDIETYIVSIVQKGKRLSAPGIQRMNFEESREIELCTYNTSLLGMRNIRVKDIVGDGVPSDTVSKYEMRFFNALYNLVPNKINKFACFSETETGVKNAGLYHNAYMNYSRNIGPDSTKNTLMSTHIDKRWDSIAVMPELDLDYQNKRMMKIHQAMIYGLVHKAIKYISYSVTNSKKKVYKFENSDERYETMIVSNGTLCDEFYEILDSLYISSSMVEDIGKIKAKKRARDVVRRSNYINTEFAKDLAEFSIEAVHDGETSLFEIPLAYWVSLPNNKRYTDEISAIVDAVVKTFRDELWLWENHDDAKFILCDILKDQFELLVKNYNENESLNQGIPAKDNAVLEIVFRKVKNVMSISPEPDDYDGVIKSLKMLIS